MTLSHIFIFSNNNNNKKRLSRRWEHQLSFYFNSNVKTISNESANDKRSENIIPILSFQALFILLFTWPFLFFYLSIRSTHTHTQNGKKYVFFFWLIGWIYILFFISIEKKKTLNVRANNFSKRKINRSVK